MKKNIIGLTFFLFVICIYHRNTYAADVFDEATAINVEEGVYKISFGKDSNMVLEIADGSKTPAANVQLGKDTSSPSQYFAILKEYDGWYTVRNVNSQYNLDAANASPEPGTNLQQWLDNKNDAQHFKFYDAGNQQVYIQSKLGTCVDLSNGESAIGNNIQLYSFNGTIAQKWILTPIVQSLSSIDIEDGNYIIHSAKNDSSVISIAETSKIAGADVQTDTYTEITSQIYTIKKDFDGWYSIKNTHSKLYLDIRNADKTTTTSLQQWIGNGQNSQKFKFYDAGNGGVIIETKYGTVLDNSNDSATAGNNIQLVLYTGANSQLWSLKPKS